jgi:hypothetical protein
MTVTSGGGIMLDKREVNALMRSAGNSVKTKAAQLINRSAGGGRVYRLGDRSYRASAPGSPPVRRTGHMRASLKTYVFKSGEGFAVRARDFYALFLEVGARGGGNPGKNAKAPINRRTGRRMRAKTDTRWGYTRRILEPRPFLDVVMAQQAPELDRRVREALRLGLKWKQTK